MKKRMLLALALVVCLVVMSACQSGGTKYTVVESNAPQATQNLNMGNTQSSQIDDPVDFDDGSYDPTSEEGRGEYFEDFGGLDEEPEAPVTPAPTVRGEYAGATPVVIDPIDKPTPTPVPPLTFTYQVYDATKLHLAFEGPVGWRVDDSAAEVYVLTNPDPSMSYAAQLTLTATAVPSKMNKTSLVDQVEAMLDSIGDGQGVKNFSPSRTADRTLMDAAGVYANYTATLSDGTEIAGRVHAACLNKVLYTVHITYPKDYRDTYVDTVYDTLRKTLNITQ